MNVTRCDVASFPSTNDHHTKEATDNDHDNVTQQQSHHHTMSNNPHHWKSDHTQGLQANTALTKATHKRRPPTTTQNGRMRTNDANRPPSRPTNNNEHPQTLKTTPTPPRSIDNGHHHPQATSVAHPHQLLTANPQATTERPPTT